jgi:ketosteroid isomerase-like protein
MSQENVEAFRRAVDAGNRRDVEALIEELDPEVEWHPTLAMLVGGEATVYRGREGARAAIRGLLEAFAEIHLEFPEIRDLDDRLVAIGRMRARGTESGAELESPWAYLVQFKNGRPTSIRGYLDPKEALEAAGLRESAISQENVEAFRRAVEANNRQDVEAPLEELDPEVEWHSGLPALLGGEATVGWGHEGARELARDVYEAFAVFHLEISEIRDLNDRIVAIGHMRARGRESETETESPWNYVVQFKNGKAVLIRTYLDLKEALQAVGLRE